jgi:hypothetical protein
MSPPVTAGPDARSPSPPAPPGGPPRVLVVVASVVVCAIGLAATILQASFLLTNDGPEHLFAAFVLNHIDDPAYAFGEYVEPNLPVTAHGFVQIFALVEPLLGWRAGYAASLIVIAQAWGLAFFALAVSLDERRWPLGLAGFALALQWAFWIGLLPFQLSTAFATGAIAAGVYRSRGARVPDGPRRSGADVATAALLLLAALCHPLPAALGGGLLVLVALFAGPGRRATRLGVLALCGAPAALVALTARDAVSGPSSWAPLVERLMLPFDHFASGPAWRGVVVVVAALAGIVVAAARGAPIERALAVGAAILLAIAITSPMTASGWEFFSPRFLPLGLSVPLALLPLERLGARARTAALLAVGAFVVGTFVWAGRFHRELDRLTAPALAVIDDVKPRPAFRQPLILRKLDAPLPVPAMAPLLHVGRTYAVVAGGTVPYGHDSLPRIHHLLRRTELPAPIDAGFLPGLQRTPPRDDDTRWRFKLTHLAQWARRTGGDVIVFGSAEDLDAFVAAGYVAEARAERVMLARFAGCAASIVVDGVSGAGYVEVSRDDGELDVRIPFDGADGARQTFTPAGLLCGPVHVRASPPCVEGDADGVVATLAPGAPTTVACTLAPPAAH